MRRAETRGPVPPDARPLIERARPAAAVCILVCQACVCVMSAFHRNPPAARTVKQGGMPAVRRALPSLDPAFCFGACMRGFVHNWCYLGNHCQCLCTLKKSYKYTYNGSCHTCYIALHTHHSRSLSVQLNMGTAMKSPVTLTLPLPPPTPPSVVCNSPPPLPTLLAAAGSHPNSS